jgi:hypothetical protein
MHFETLIVSEILAFFTEFDKYGNSVWSLENRNGNEREAWTIQITEWMNEWMNEWINEIDEWECVCFTFAEFEKRIASQHKRNDELIQCKSVEILQSSNSCLSSIVTV